MERVILRLSCVLSLILSLNSVPLSRKCVPCKCCSHPLQLCVDCRYRHFDSIPTFPHIASKDVRLLSLVGNRISTFNSTVFDGLHNLQVLDLGNNGIAKLDAGTFANLSQLTTLYLSRNNLKTIEADMFTGLHNLNALWLDGNKIANVHDGPFANLTKLITLSLYNNKLSKVKGKMFKGLGNLNKLWLSYNGITTVDGRSFDSLSNLLELDLSANNMAEIELQTFEGLGYLKKLWLSRNKIQTIESQMFTGLTNLKGLWLDDNQIVRVDGGSFSDLTELMILSLNHNRLSKVKTQMSKGLVKLEELWLRRNEITTIEEGSFASLSNLQELYLQINKMRKIEEHMFKGLWNVKELYFYGNEITTVDEGSFINLSKLRILSLTSNKITAIKPHTFRGLTNLDELRLHDNHITSIGNGSFAYLSSLLKLTLGNNKLSVIKENLFKRLGNLEHLYLNENKINMVDEGSFVDLIKLKELWLHRNNMTEIKEKMFKGLENLDTLTLNYNRIAGIDDGSFVDLRKLTTLDVQGNRISKIRAQMFEGLSKLKWLMLEDNLITILNDGSFVELLSLENLKLTRNSISSTGANVFQGLTKLKKLFLVGNDLREIPGALWAPRLDDVYVDIRDNPFVCSCNLMNNMKQLRAKCKIMRTNVLCANTTNTCEETRNFALGMHVSAIGLSESYNVNDGDFSTSCGHVFDVLEDFESWIRVDLPGLIVVTKVVMYGRSSKENIRISVGDKLTESFEVCGVCSNMSPHMSSCPLHHPSMSFCNISCTEKPRGSSMTIEYEDWDDQCKQWDEGKLMGEVMVFGYELNKYNVWGEWGIWSSCSQTCGNGIRSRFRNCTEVTSAKCSLPGTSERYLSQSYNETCNVKACPESKRLFWGVIGGLVGFFVLIASATTFWYRKYKMIRYAEGLRPNPNFEMDPNRTLLEQVAELPYDLHWEFPRKHVNFGTVLGEGNFGRVWYAKARGIKAFNPRDKGDLSTRSKLSMLQDTNMPQYFTNITEGFFLGFCDSTELVDVAVKTLKECATPEHKMDLASELKLLIYMGRHPNIVNILGSCTIRGDLWVIMEYCDHGSLLQFLRDRRIIFTADWSKSGVSVLDEICFFDLLSMAIQITKGIMFLHWWKVVHRDLASRNILVSADFTMKIADFGLARPENYIAEDNDIIPIKWCALESLLRHECTRKCDVWSFGVVLWEMFSLGAVPYPGMTSHEVIKFLKDGHRMEAPDDCPKEIYDIICECWCDDVEARPSMAGLLQQLDDVKRIVSSAPEGRYYGSGDDVGDVINVGQRTCGEEIVVDIHQRNTDVVNDDADAGHVTIHEEGEEIEMGNINLVCTNDNDDNDANDASDHEEEEIEEEEEETNL